MKPQLDIAMEAYQRHLPELLANQGKFVLIFGDAVIGVYDTYLDALAAGYEKYGMEPFFVKQIQAIENAQFFTRDILCQS
ncbi:MAG: hypothetical protein NTV22_04025 [bacterium]|nr:hypothetical protein [bacterium]